MMATRTSAGALKKREIQGGTNVSGGTDANRRVSENVPDCHNMKLHPCNDRTCTTDAGNVGLNS